MPAGRIRPIDPDIMLRADSLLGPIVPGRIRASGAARRRRRLAEGGIAGAAMTAILLRRMHLAQWLDTEEGRGYRDVPRATLLAAAAGAPATLLGFAAQSLARALNGQTVESVA